jgi:hypothetical protein
MEVNQRINIILYSSIEAQRYFELIRAAYIILEPNAIFLPWQMAIIRNPLSGIDALTQIVVLHRWRIAFNKLSACLSADSVRAASLPPPPQGVLRHKHTQRIPARLASAAAGLF